MLSVMDQSDHSLTVLIDLFTTVAGLRELELDVSASVIAVVAADSLP